MLEIQFFVVLLFSSLASGQTYDPEREGLMSFFKSTSQHGPWKDSQGWLEAFVHQCRWFGVSCDENKRVVGVNLTANGLSGGIEAGIQYLTSLKYLNLSNNKIETISDGLTFLTQLEVLDLSTNLLQSLPYRLGSLTNLRILNVGFNQLNNLPVFFGSLETLTELHLEFNNLAEFPPISFSDDPVFPNVRLLNLGFNSRAELGESLWNMTNLQQLTLSGIAFSGSLPSQIGQLTNLQSLDMTECRLTSLASEIGFLHSLQTLNLGDNQLSSLPWESLNNLVSLQALQLAHNQAVSELDLESESLKYLWLEGCPNIQGFDLMKTPNVVRLSFTGPQLQIPSGFLWKFEYLVLSGLDEAPSNIDLSVLQVMIVRDTKIDRWPDSYLNHEFSQLSLFSIQNSPTSISWCPFPEWIKNAPKLQQLFLLGNISGSIPTEIGLLSQLTSLSLTNSQISGSIPTEIGLLTALTELVMNGLGHLQGQVPTSLGNLVTHGQLSSLSLGEVPRLDPKLDPALAVLSNISSCNLILGGNQSFTCEISGALGGNICNVVCSSKYDIFGTWMNHDGECKKVRADSRLATWNRTLLQFEQVGPNISFFSVTSVGVGCSIGVIKIVNTGFLRVYETIENDVAKIRIKVGFEIVSRSMMFLVSSGVLAVKTVCPGLFQQGETIPMNQAIDITNRECSSSIEPLSFKPTSSCPVVYDILDFDFENNLLSVGSNVPPFVNADFCYEFPNETALDTGIYLNRGWECQDPASTLPLDQSCFPDCGDRELIPPEACDDGNQLNGDGCSDSCQIEPGWTCIKQDCAPICGDKKVVSQTDCDASSIHQKEQTKLILPVVLVSLVVIALGLTVSFVLLRSRKRTFIIDEKEIQLLDVLGEGNFGQVFKGLWRGTTLVAVKKLKFGMISTQEMNSFRKEAFILSHIPPHPNIVQFLGLCVTTSSDHSEQRRSVFGNREEHPSSEQKKIQIITEYLEEGNLAHYMKKKKYENSDPQNEDPSDDGKFQRKYLLIADLCKGIAAGMDHLHQNKVVHGDLAARNILVQNVHSPEQGEHKIIPKISDFGLATKNAKHRRPFAVRWTAPEILMGASELTPATDVWSFGILMYELMTDCSVIPYQNISSNIKVREHVLIGGQVERPENAPTWMWSLMKSCFAMTPLLRPPFSTLYRGLDLERENELHSEAFLALNASNPTMEAVKDFLSRSRGSESVKRLHLELFDESDNL